MDIRIRMAVTLINDISTTYFDRTYLCHDLAIKTDVLDSAQKAESSTDISCAVRDRNCSEF